MDISKKAMEFRFVRTALPRPRNIGIPDQRARKIAASLVALAEELIRSCANDSVFELTHANGRTLHLCEYHIECYWNFWPTFRDAIRDLWPVRLQSRS